MGVCGGGGLDKGQKYNRFSTNMIAFFCKMSVVGGVQDIFRILIVLNAKNSENNCLFNVFVVLFVNSI